MIPLPGIETAEILDGIRSWVEIESPTDDVAAVARMVACVRDEAAALGAAIEPIPLPGFADGIRARSPWGGDGPGILLLAHLDTVHPIGTLAGDLPFRVEGDRAYGPGTYDMKGGAYIALHALRAFVRQGRETRLPITFLFTTDEEMGSTASRPRIEAEARANKYVIVAEPCRQGNLVTARKGTARFQIDFFGRPAHSGSKHEEGRNAIKEMARHILDLEALTDYARGVTLNVGVVTGGTRYNVVPAHARLHLDVRLPDRECVDGIVSRVRGLAPHDPDVRIEVTGRVERPPFERLPHGAALFERVRALGAEMGLEIGEVAVGGASDGNFTAPIAPTVDGMGIAGAGAHTLEEYMDVSSLAPRCALLHRLFGALD